MKFVKRAGKSNLHQESDRKLVLLARSGQQLAFVEIVTRHQNLVVGVALSILQDFAKSEDAAQDCFVRAWKQLAKLSDPEKLRPWLAQIARNSALDLLSKDPPIDTAAEEFDHLEDPGIRPDESLVESEERETVLKALGSLPEKYRLPLVLFYCDEKSISSVAQALDLSEAAVKQRLSRGRAKLRNRMSKLIESVLMSRRPNPLLTASIATAIGALTKPSAVAATAMKTTTTTVAMTSSKSTFSTVVLLVAVSLPIGYSAHKVIEEDPTPPTSNQVAKSDSQTSSIKPINFSLEESELVKKWRILRANYGDQHSDLIQLQTDLAKIENRIHRRAFTAVLIAEWTELHPAKGLQFFREGDHDEWQRDLFLQELFQRDASQAIDTLIASGDGWEKLGPKFLNEIAQQSPHRLAAFVDLLPQPNYHRDQSIEDAFDLFAQNNLHSARRAADEVSGPNRPRAFAGIARAWAERDGQAALDWAEEIDDPKLRESTKWAVLAGWARVDPQAALSQLPTNPTSPISRDNREASMVLSEAAEHDFDSTMIWIQDNREKFGSGSLWGLSKSFDQRLLADPTGFLSNLDELEVLELVMDNVERSLMNEAGSSLTEIMAWLLVSETSSAKSKLERKVLNSLARSKPSTAMKIADGFADPEKRDEARKTIASGMTNGGQNFDVANQLFDTASPDWKVAITSEVFRTFFSEQVPNFRTWADRLVYLPEERRVSAHRTVGRSWAAAEPMSAANWALARSESDQREAALKGVSSGWASRSPSDAREWIESQLSGSEKEIAVSGFVTGAFWENPDDAVTMVNSIPSDQTRIELVEEIIEMNGTHQWNKVLEMIEEVDLSKTRQEELREIVSNKR